MLLDDAKKEAKGSSNVQEVPQAVEAKSQPPGKNSYYYVCNHVVSLGESGRNLGGIRNYPHVICDRNQESLERNGSWGVIITPPSSSS